MKKPTDKTGAYAGIGTDDWAASAVPIPIDRIGTRISAAADRLKTRKNAATAMGVSTDALQRYIREENVPPFDAIARLCRASGTRFEWMAFAEAPELVQKTASESQSPPLRLDVLTIAIQLAEEALEGKTLEPEKRAELFGLVYEGLVEGMPEAKILRWARAAAS